MEDKVLERVSDLYPGIALYKAHIDYYREQDKNARVLDKGKFDRLKENIAESGTLESMPLCYLTTNDSGNKELTIISGHHRIRAARMANPPVLVIFSMVIERELTQDEVTSKQLAHNALSGIDDPQILRELYESIDDVNQRIASGITEVDLKPNWVELQETDIVFEYKTETIKILFLESQYKDMQEASKLIEDNEVVLLADYKDFNQFAKAMQEISKNEEIRNAASIIHKMASIVIDYYKNMVK
jgi:hypothetical protein